MKRLKFIVLATFLTSSTAIIAQDSTAVEAPVQDKLLSEAPKTAKAYPASEKNFIASAEWIENTALNAEEAKRKEQYALYGMAH